MRQLYTVLFSHYSNVDLRWDYSKVYYVGRSPVRAARGAVARMMHKWVGCCDKLKFRSRRGGVSRLASITRTAPSSISTQSTICVSTYWRRLPTSTNALPTSLLVGVSTLLAITSPIGPTTATTVIRTTAPVLVPLMGASPYHNNNPRTSGGFFMGGFQVAGCLNLGR